MRRVLLVCAVVLTAASVQEARAQLSENLDLVQVPSEVTCNFDQDCLVTSDDQTTTFQIRGAFGNAALHSRMWPQGEPNTEGALLYPFVYRLDLSGMMPQRWACVSEVSIEFGPVSRLDYDDNGDLDDVWVMTSGGLGSIAPTRVVRSHPWVTFYFAKPVCAGQSSFYFGLMSQWGYSGGVPARIVHTGGSVTVATRSPWNLIR